MDWDCVEKDYGFKIHHIEKVRNVYKLVTNKGAKCFKKAHIRPSYFCFVFSAIEHLINKGFDGVIAYDKTIDGNICLMEDEYIYYVLPWIESRQCRFKHKEELKLAIKTAALLHIFSVGFVAPEHSKPRIYYGKWSEKFTNRCLEIKRFKEIIEKKPSKDSFDEAYYPLIDYYLNQGYEAIEMLEKSSYPDISKKSMGKGEFCHHDMAEHNFIITSNEDMKIIDFDYCIMDSKIHDVASLIIRNMKRGIWDVKKAYFILNEYSKHNQLSNKEIEAIKYFMIFPQDFWQLGLQYYIEKQNWTMENFISKLDIIKADKNLRHNFLNNFIAIV